MGAMARGESDPSAKWQAAGCGAHYAGARFDKARARDRDLSCVLGLLRRQLGPGVVERLLDMPCGSGRLSRGLAERTRRYVGADASRSMLDTAAPTIAELAIPALTVEAAAPCLPFCGASFDAVIACRFLHHLHSPHALAQAIQELVRVSRGLVIASFWDADSLPQLRRSLGLKRSEGPRGRVAVSRAHIRSLFESAGADVVDWRASLRFVSQQTFVAARVRARST
jgi:SAM-dependent methyltransferase